MEKDDIVIFDGKEARIIKDWKDGYFDIEYLHPENKFQTTELSIHSIQLKKVEIHNDDYDPFLFMH